MRTRQAKPSRIEIYKYIYKKKPSVRVFSALCKIKSASVECYCREPVLPAEGPRIHISFCSAERLPCSILIFHWVVLTSPLRQPIFFFSPSKSGSVYGEWMFSSGSSGKLVLLRSWEEFYRSKEPEPGIHNQTTDV